MIPHLLAAAVALTLAAAGPPKSAADGAPAARGRGKPSAPASVDAQVTGGAARVTVRFDSDASDVRIDVHGASGLSVTSEATPVEHARFARGEAATFDVAFTPGPGRSQLAVAVVGKFRGVGKRTRIVSFAVGAPTPEQRKAGGTVVEGPGAERIKVVAPGH
ncbi:MAG TPA: hypothetical protein VF841_18145 [Anaeromyxobacter sp.]